MDVDLSKGLSTARVFWLHTSGTTHQKTLFLGCMIVRGLVQPPHPRKRCLSPDCPVVKW